MIVTGAERETLAGALPGYEIGEEIGRGSSGVVLAGTHRGLGREVAIKRLPRMLGGDPERRMRFLSEARLLASLDHPHIVRLYDFVEAAGICALVMQRLNGGTVWDRLERGAITPQAACAVAVGTCSALQYAHAKGVLHRDIKPQNLMFSEEGVLKVTDFGIAKVLGDAEATVALEERIVGTPAYISPEQVQGGALGPAVDVYAVGVVLYVLLCGRLPYPPAADPMLELYQHVHTDPVPLSKRDPSLPPALGDITARALSREPAARYPSAQELEAAVAFAAAEEWGADWATRTGVVLLGAQAPAVAGSARAPTLVDHEVALATPELGDGLYVAGVDDELVDQLYQELAWHTDDPTPARLRVLCRLAIELHIAGTPVERSQALLAEAREISSALGDPHAEAVLLYSDLVATWSPHDLAGRLSSAAALTDLAEDMGAPDIAFRGRRLLLRALLEQGDDDATERELASLDAYAAQLARPWYRWQAKLLRATVALREGHADEARELMQAAFEAGQRVEPDLSRRCFDEQAIGHRRLVGARDELVPALREAVQSCPWLLARQAAWALALAECRRLTEALVQFEELARGGFVTVPRDADWLATMVLLSGTCSRLRDRPRARLLHGALAPYRDRVAVTGDCTLVWGPVSVALDELAPLV